MAFKPISEQAQGWSLTEARALLDFFLPAAINPKGGFHALGVDGKPLPNDEREIHATTRMVHCAAIGQLLGLEGAHDAVDHGMEYLWSHHRDQTHGGYFWAVNGNGPSNALKQAYGHAFVLLAASSAEVVGHPGADRLLTDITDVLLKRFWDAEAGATTEEYEADWSPISDYRGQNSNMHLTEALMAAFEATGDGQYLSMAKSISELIINRHARAQDWRVAEHFDAAWSVDLNYSGDPMFRPAGVTPGHALEWARLLVQLWHLDGKTESWMVEAAQGLFKMACATAWDSQTGGYYYTLDWHNQPDQANRFWWPCCEGLAAAGVLRQVSDDAEYDVWFERIRKFIDGHLIDRTKGQGGWHGELDGDLKPTSEIFEGRPDIYHALQACLIPLLPADGSITFQLSKPEIVDPLRSAFR